MVLLSGGIDSTTTLAIAMQEVEECVALTFRYGQKHAMEVSSAARVVRAMGVDTHLIVKLPLQDHVVSALTSDSIAVPQGQKDAAGVSASIPPTYVPARNTIFLSYALAIAETTEAGRIYTGVSSVDYSGYPDCRPEFIRAFQQLADVATKRAAEGDRVEILAPLQYMSKAETIRRGGELGVDYSLTLSCYEPDNRGRACGSCESCGLRRSGFATANVKDPTHYQ